MPRFTIRRNGIIMGTYTGEDEDAALDHLATNEGHQSFKDFCKKTGMKRDDHKIEEVKE